MEEFLTSPLKPKTEIIVPGTESAIQTPIIGFEENDIILALPDGRRYTLKKFIITKGEADHIDIIEGTTDEPEEKNITIKVIHHDEGTEVIETMIDGETVPTTYH